jgi:DNA repair ATPase RecN
MKLDLKRMAGAIAANAENGPGDPIEELNKKLAAQNLYYDKVSKTVKRLPDASMNRKNIENKVADAMYQTNMKQSLNMSPEQMRDLPGFEKSYDRMMQQVPESGDELKEMLIKQGIMAMNPKTGDVSITQKGREMNKKGLLSKYKMEF